MAAHPYLPADLELPHYVANTLSMTYILGWFFAAIIVVVVACQIITCACGVVFCVSGCPWASSPWPLAHSNVLARVPYGTCVV